MKKFFSSYEKKQFIILMLGAPGVGKGTYSKLLSKDINIPELSTGDLLRKIIAQKENQSNPIFNKIAETLSKGKLVEDDYMFNMVKETLNKDEFKNGAILDGFPRNVNQCVPLESYKKIDLVLNIQLNEDVLVKKLLGRRVCKDCGRNYNVCEIKENGYDMEPLLPKKNINYCDDCNCELYIRTDDKEEIIRDRLNLYVKNTKILENYFDNKNVLKSMELKKGIKDYPILRQIVKDTLKI